jgi:peptidoglycan/xylan/chitin deacetylase (PgdA/CDA1 family)
MRRILVSLILVVLAVPAPLAARASDRPVEVHQRLALPQPQARIAALTLDACGGNYDARLIRFLVEERIPATVFATRKWIERNREGVATLHSHPELFDIEDHGADHVPAVIGLGRRVYGLPGNADVAHLESEVRNGAAAVESVTGHAPRWYRGATAEYDAEALRVIAAMGYKVAGFSINADAGATLKREAIVARLNSVAPGDIIIAHMNRPLSDTAEGLSAGLKALLARGFRFVKLNDVEVRPAPG